MGIIAVWDAYILRDLLPQLWPLGETSPKRSHEGTIAFGRLRMGGFRDGFGQRGRGGEPKADEHRQHLDGNPDIALKPNHASVELVEPGESSGVYREVDFKGGTLNVVGFR